MAGLVRGALPFLCSLFAIGAVASSARAINLTIDQTIPSLGGASSAPVNAEGIAVIHTGPNRGIYIPHRDDGNVTVLNLDTGAFVYRFNSGLGGNLRAIDVLDDDSLVIGGHTSNFVREVNIPANPGDGSIPNATFGTIAFGAPFAGTQALVHTDHGGVPYDEFEALSVFRRPSDNALFMLLAEEGLENPAGGEFAGEVFLGQVSGNNLINYEKLFDVPLGDGDDDISGIDVIDVRFDGSGNLDRANSRIIITDDSSGNDSGAFVLNMLGQIVESLEGPGGGTGSSFESLFGQPWRDAEGVDYDPATGLMTFVFSTGGNPAGTPVVVVFETEFEVPPTPEPAALVLLAPLAGLLALRRRS